MKSTTHSNTFKPIPLLNQIKIVPVSKNTQPKKKRKKLQCLLNSYGCLYLTITSKRVET